ncbi:hypothetical protein CTEN210_09951 [Chaetoceros tenuissimus]|uniref:DUF1996 domain-containing protein n=1 Tax=Chaetoceros tenuissimus TaxID=426638 RepID=A0AAD3CYS1_9STRA|nr:hypothetical protein CTEN210_09951 [Chaetoceros tenuissimus]
MKVTNFTAALNLGLISAFWFAPASVAQIEEGTGNMVKMCLFYGSPSGHARTDPIITETDLSDHVHTFYGPLNFHPKTSNDDLRNTSSNLSTSPFVENQSLYWHPSIYEKTRDASPTYTRVSNLETSPYYRWDNSVADTKAFPKDFRMIAYSDQANANQGGESGGNFFTECCNIVNGEEDCTSTFGKVEFPKQNCGFLGMAMSMPTCANGDSDSPDHKSHVAYTLNGEVAGPCPTSHPLRLPQVQLFIRIGNYRGAEVDYVLADERDVFHVDFMNGWQERDGVSVLQNIIDNCPIEDQGNPSYNPPCTCDQFLTQNTAATGAMCDSDVRTLIADEATDIVSQLPRKSSSNTSMIPKSWPDDPSLSCTPTVPENPNEEEEEEEPEDEEPCEGEDCEEEEEPEDEEPEDEEPCEGEDCEEEEEPEDEEPCEGEDCEEEEEPEDEEPCEGEDCEEEEDEPDVGPEEDEVPQPTSCLDSDRKFLFNAKNKQCKWVGKNANVRCAKTADDGQSISSLCPLACATITSCAPSDNSSSFLHPKNGSVKTCAWANSAKKCKRFWVVANCPVSCAPYI